MLIRRMTIEDYDQVYTVWLSCQGMGLNNVDDSREGIAKYLKRNPKTCFVAVEDKRVIGAILSGHDGRRGTVRHTAVSPGCRGKGAGRRLVEAAVNGLKNEGITKVNLVVFSANENGNAFWEHMGFSRRDDLVYRNRALADLKRIDT